MIWTGLVQVKVMDGWIEGWWRDEWMNGGLDGSPPPPNQAMLSAAPGSNIHLAWCIPELETLMWFVGESRWQVHGSALLTDRAGASGVAHNNSQRLSPPFFLFRRSIYIMPPKPIFNTHQQEQFFFFSPSLSLISMFILQDCTRKHSACWHSAQSYLPPHLLFCCSSCFLALSVLSTLSPCASLLSYFITLTPTPITLLHMPLNWSPIILWLLFAPSITAVTLPLTLLPRLPLIGNSASHGLAVGVISYSKSIHI